MWDVSSPTRDQTHIYIARQTLNHWATKEMPLPFITEGSAKNSEGWGDIIVFSPSGPGDSEGTLWDALLALGSNLGPCIGDVES